MNELLKGRGDLKLEWRQDISVRKSQLGVENKDYPKRKNQKENRITKRIERCECKWIL